MISFLYGSTKKLFIRVKLGIILIAQHPNINKIGTILDDQIFNCIHYTKIYSNYTRERRHLKSQDICMQS